MTNGLSANQIWEYQEISEATSQRVIDAVDASFRHAQWAYVGSICYEAAKDRMRSAQTVLGKTYRRIIVNVPVDEQSCDLFMNDRSGYRGHFFAGEEAGEAFNDELIYWIEQHLENVCRERLADWSEDEIRASICGGKLWVSPQRAEAMLPVRRWGRPWEEKLGDFQTALAQQIGVEKADEYVQKLPNDRKKFLRERAPQRIMGDEFTFKGAYVSHDGQTIVPKEKKFRDLQIHCFGAS